MVGNHIAKYQALKLAKMLMAYDFDRRLNPFAELGGFIFTFMGDGKPGTGKTTLIQMMAGLLNDYCPTRAIRSAIRTLAQTISTAIRVNPVRTPRRSSTLCIDPAVIGFGTIDDIDQAGWQAR